MEIQDCLQNLFPSMVVSKLIQRINQNEQFAFLKILN